MDGFSESYKCSDPSAVFAHHEAGSQASSKANPLFTCKWRDTDQPASNRMQPCECVGRKESLCTCLLHLFSDFLQDFKVCLEMELTQLPLPTE